MKYIQTTVLAFLGIMFLVTGGVFAQMQTTPIAEVNVTDAKIGDQLQNIVSIPFTISNGKGVQSSVRYSVRLTPKDTPGITLDDFVFDETLTLFEQSTVFKNVVYTAPTYLSGEFDLYLTLGNDTGFPFANVFLGEVKLSATTASVVIDTKSCTARIEGNQQSKKLSLEQSLVLGLYEKIALECSVINETAGDIMVTPTVTTQYRSSFGSSVPQQDYTQPQFILKKGEKRTLTLILPVATVPQNYVAKVMLSSGTLQSNAVVVRYTLRGAMGTIGNLSTDKDSYKRKDIAQISLVWTAANVQNTRAEVIIKSKSFICGRESVSALTKGVHVFSVLIKYRCTDPTVKVSLYNGETLLEEKEFTIETQSQKNSGIFSGRQGNFFLFGIAILSGIIILVVRKISHKKNPPIVPLTLLFFTAGFLGSATNAQAYTYTAGANNDVFVTVNVQNVSNPGSTSYQQGDQIRVDSNVHNNAPYDQAILFSAGTIGNDSIHFFPRPMFFVDLAFPDKVYLSGGEQRFAQPRSFTVNTQGPGTFPLTFSTGVEDVAPPSNVRLDSIGVTSHPVMGGTGNTNVSCSASLNQPSTQVEEATVNFFTRDENTSNNAVAGSCTIVFYPGDTYIDTYPGIEYYGGDITITSQCFAGATVLPGQSLGMPTC